MTADRRTIIIFRGLVRCSRGDGPLALVLRGTAADGEEASLAFAFAGTDPPRLPESLSDVTVEQESDTRYRIVSGGTEWAIAANGCHLHRDISESFYRAIKPRPARWSKKLFWTLVLALMGSRPGKRLLLALRRH